MPKNTGVGCIPEPAFPVVKAVEPRHVQAAFESILDLFRKVNGEISLGDATPGTVAGNWSAEWAGVYFPNADTNVTIRHTLRRVPVGYLVTRRDLACIVYDSPDQAWSDKTISLRSDTSATVDLLIF